MAFGTLVINEHVLQVVEVALHGGTVVVTARMSTEETVRLPTGCEWRIYGDDGVLVVTGRIDIPDVVTRGYPRDPATVTVVQPLGFAGKVAESWRG